MSSEKQTLVALAEQDLIDARHARLAAEEAQNPSDRQFATSQAAMHERRALSLQQRIADLDD
jgi:hypothetical protein